MRRMHRIVLLVALVALAPVLVGCEGFDNEKFDFFSLNEKKKLKGERKELFPQGVPGVTQGLPPEYLNKNPQPNAASPTDRPVGSIAGDLARAPMSATAAAAAPNNIDNAAAPVPPSKPAPRQPRQ